MKMTVIQKHVPNCWADQKYGGEWVIEDARFLRRDSLGRANKKAMTRFLLFRCNDASCPAQMIVREFDVIKACGISSRRTS